VNDARMPADFVASERARDQEIFRREEARIFAQSQNPHATSYGSEQNMHASHPRGVLTVEQAAARQANARIFAQSQEPHATSYGSEQNIHASADPMLAVRLSLAAVLVLIVIWIWIKQRKK